MISEIKKSNTNALAIEVIEGFTETDKKLCRKLFEKKLNLGFESINLLVKIDETKISHSNVKAFFDDIIHLLRNYKTLGNLAIVAHFNVLKALVPNKNLFSAGVHKGRKEHYFDISQLEKAFIFIESKS
jgi:hypothetical protein